MSRKWVTVMQGGRELERPIHNNKNNSEYIVMRGKHLFLDRLEADGRLVACYNMGRADE